MFYTNYLMNRARRATRGLLSLLPLLVATHGFCEQARPAALPTADSNAAALLTQGAASALPSAAVSFARRGDSAVRAGDFSGAARFYAAAALSAPRDSLLRVQTGVALSSARHLELAIPEFRQAIRLDDGDVVAKLLLQAALADSGYSDEAQALHQETYRRFAPASGLARLDASGSEQRLSARLAIEPNSPVLMLLLGDANQLGEDWAKADDAYRGAHLLAPRWSKPLVNRGLALLAVGRSDDAISVFSMALRLDPGNAQLKVWMGEAELRGGRKQHAITTLEAVARTPAITPSVRSQAAADLGQALANQQSYTKAVASLNHARDLTPKDPSPAAVLGDVQLQAGNYVAATRAYEDALRLTESDSLFGDRAVLFRALAEAQLSAHRPDSALETLRQALADVPANAAVWHRLAARANFDQGAASDGEDELCRALNAEPDRYPFDTLNAVAARNLLPKVRDRYEARLDADTANVETRVATNGNIAIRIHPPTSAGEAERDRAQALSALANIARYDRRTKDEIALRLKLTTLRTNASDWYLLGEAYDQRAGMPVAARNAYGRAVGLPGLDPARRALATKRLSTLTTAAYKP